MAPYTHCRYGIDPNRRHAFVPHPRHGFQLCWVMGCPFDNDHPVHDICGKAKKEDFDD